MAAFDEDAWRDQPEDPEPWAWERRRALLLGEVRPGERVLDLGCGAGRFVGALRSAGCAAIGVDVAPAALERARRVVPGGDFRLADPDGTLPLGHGEIDLVWCSETLEHVVDTAPILSEARRVLRRGGRILVTTPDHGRLRRTLIALARFDAHFDPLGGHLRFYTERSLTVVLANAGFAPPEVTRFGGLPGLRTTLVARAERA